jgi:4-amino-4-deoxy-L-arabinose transferase-like glycosyltransferase
MTVKKEIVFLLVILAIASFFRLWKLDSIPPGLYPDVAINGNDASDSLKTGNFKVFYPENNGREGLMIWLIALSFSVFGVSIWSIKITAAIVGILTVLGLYLLTKELFGQIVNRSNSQFIPILASFFLAVSFWHTNFSRIGFRAILLPFVLVFSFYFLLRAFRKKSIFDSILAGIFFGLGFYTYTSFRMAVLILPFLFIPFWFLYKREGLQKKFLLLTSCFLLLTFFVALPIGIYFLKNPQDFISRAAPISIFVAENPIKELGKSLILHLGMFNFYGDPNWRHNFSGSPMLPWPLGILFLIGIFFSIKELIASIKEKNYSLATVYCLLLSWFFIMLLPGILTYEGIPHSLRVIGVIPVVYIFVALGGLKIYQFFERNNKKKKLLIFACLLFLIAIFFSEFDKYFVRWGKNSEVENAFSSDYVKMGNYLNSLSPEIQKYVIVNMPGVPVPYPNGIPMPAQTLMFIERTEYGEIRSFYLLPEDLNLIKINKKTVIVPMKYDEELFNELTQKFPKGKITKENKILIYDIK